jgi:hypothetical protein
MWADNLNKIILSGSAILALVAFWHRNDLPGDIAFVAELEREPLQKSTSKQPFSVELGGVGYTVEPQYDYDLYGMIVSFRHHDGNSRMHRLSNDHLNVADLCVVWSGNAFNEHLSKISFWNGIFTCNFETRDSEAWASFKLDQISNNHLISDDSAIRDRVSDVRIGDQVHIRGWLSSYGSDGGSTRGTSTTRNDTGDGACETIFVTEFGIVEPAFSPWRATMYAALAVLAISLIVYFRAPYKPYR